MEQAVRCETAIRNRLPSYGNIWLFIPVQQKLKAVRTPEFPFQPGSSLNAAGINYNSIQAMRAMKRLNELESLPPPTE
jgi:arylsulfatase